MLFGIIDILDPDFGSGALHFVQVAHNPFKCLLLLLLLLYIPDAHLKLVLGIGKSTEYQQSLETSANFSFPSYLPRVELVSKYI